MLTKQQAIKELKQIRGVGISIANDLWNIGITSIKDLKAKDPELLYHQSNKFASCKGKTKKRRSGRGGPCVIF